MPIPPPGPIAPMLPQCCWLYAPDKPKVLASSAEAPLLLQNLHEPPFLLLLASCCTEAQEQIHHEELALRDREEVNPEHQGLLEDHQGPWASRPLVGQGPALVLGQPGPLVHQPACFATG